MSELSPPRGQTGRNYFRSYRNPVLRKACMAHAELALSLSASFGTRPGMHLTSRSMAHESLDGGMHVSRDCQTNCATELLASESEGLCSNPEGLFPRCSSPVWRASRARRRAARS